MTFFRIFRILGFKRRVRLKINEIFGQSDREISRFYFECVSQTKMLKKKLKIIILKSADVTVNGL